MLQLFTWDPVLGVCQTTDGEEWEKFMSNMDRRRIGKTMVPIKGKPGEYATVSTVFLGMDHGGGTFWESIVFYPDGTSGHETRYTSREEAIAGHLSLLHDLLGEVA